MNSLIVSRDSKMDKKDSSHLSSSGRGKGVKDHLEETEDESMEEEEEDDDEDISVDDKNDSSEIHRSTTFSKSGNDRGVTVNSFLKFSIQNILQSAAADGGSSAVAAAVSAAVAAAASR